MVRADNRNFVILSTVGGTPVLGNKAIAGYIASVDEGMETGTAVRVRVELSTALQRAKRRCNCDVEVLE